MGEKREWGDAVDTLMEQREGLKVLASVTSEARTGGSAESSLEFGPVCQSPARDKDISSLEVGPKP